MNLFVVAFIAAIVVVGYGFTLLLDLELPGIDGWEVARRLVADPSTAEIPVVAITAHAQKTFVDRAFEAGCVDVVTKPFMPEELPERLETALRGQAD